MTKTFTPDNYKTLFINGECDYQIVVPEKYAPVTIDTFIEHVGGLRKCVRSQTEDSFIAQHKDFTHMMKVEITRAVSETHVEFKATFSF